VLEVVEVAVVVDEGLRARQPAAVDDRRVVELVGEDDVAPVGQCRHHAHVGEVARAEQQRGLGALERREALLEPAVDGHRARDESRGPGADAPAHRRVGRRLTHARVIGEAEVVVRAQQEDRLAVEDDAGALGPAHEAHLPEQPAVPKLGEALLHVGHAAVFSSGQAFSAPSGRGGTVAFLA
jgi:hypothetical protein